MHGDRGPDRGGGQPGADELGPNAALGEEFSRPLAWAVRPCARNWLLAAVVVVFILGLSLAAQLQFGSPWWGALTLALLSLSVLPYYSRTHYRLDREGVVARGLIGTYRRPWSEIRAYFPHADGVLLSPLAKPSRLAYTRGIFVRFDNNRDEVLDRVEAYSGLHQRGNTSPDAESGAD